MQFNKLKPIVPHLVAVLLFIAIPTVYFYPQLEGYQLHQGDTDQAIGMSKEISDFREKYGSEPLWTSATFSGMPAYQISAAHSNYVSSIENVLLLKPFSRPIGYIMIAMLASYILLLCFGLSPWLSMIGAIAFGFSSIFMLYLGAGHNSKVHAIALLPTIIGSILLAYRKNYVMGGLLLAFFLCLEISANHLQMTYYSMFLIASIVIVELILHIKDKLFLKFVKVSSVLLVAAILAILPSFTILYTTYEYGKYSTRGKSELTITPSAKENTEQSSADALEPWYITQYSMGTGEVWSLAIPDVKGGAQNYLGNKKEAMENVNSQFRDYIAQSPSYWGEQAGSGGAFYFGVTMFVLFILGLVFIKDPIKWAFLAASALAVVLSWKHGSILQFFINHFPLFNKFRDTKMMLIIVQIAFPFVGLLFIKEIFTRQIDKKKLLYALLAINGVFLLFYLMPGTFFDFLSASETDNFAKQIASYQNKPDYQAQFNNFLTELEHARMVIFKADVLWSLFFSLLVSGIVYLFVAGKVKKNYLMIGLGILVLVDLWRVDKRYLNNEEAGNGYKMWVEKQRSGNPYRAAAADMFILNHELEKDPALRSKIDQSVAQALSKVKYGDTEIQKERLTFSELGFSTNYRVLSLQDPFSNGEVSYFHKSLGGYHGAKLKKYQELIDFYISKEINLLANSIQDTTATNQKITDLLQNKLPVLNMLNTKYIIYNPGTAPLVNLNGNGNAWFVRDLKYAEDANDEMRSLGEVNLKATAVVNKKYKDGLVPFNYDSTASLKLESFKPNQLIYKSKSKAPQFAVFSEVYYPKGWDVFVDGKKASYISANYILRAMNVPAGEHTIEFRFEPKSYYIGEKVSIASSLLLIVLLSGAIIFGVYKKFKP